jgi:hypothetical protein
VVVIADGANRDRLRSPRHGSEVEATSARSEAAMRRALPSGPAGLLRGGLVPEEIDPRARARVDEGPCRLLAARSEGPWAWPDRRLRWPSGGGLDGDARRAVARWRPELLFEGFFVEAAPMFIRARALSFAGAQGAWWSGRGPGRGQRRRRGDRQRSDLEQREASILSATTAIERDGGASKRRGSAIAPGVLLCEVALAPPVVAIVVRLSADRRRQPRTCWPRERDRSDRGRLSRHRGGARVRQSANW